MHKKIFIDVDPNLKGQHAHAAGGNGELLIFRPFTNTNLSYGMLAHEAAHSLDRGGRLSNTKEYQDAMIADGKLNSDSRYTSLYAEGAVNRSDGKYKEDFADLFNYTITYGADAAKTKFPNRVEFLKKHAPQVHNELFGGV